MRVAPKNLNQNNPAAEGLDPTPRSEEKSAKKEAAVPVTFALRLDLHSHQDGHWLIASMSKCSGSYAPPSQLSMAACSGCFASGAPGNPAAAPPSSAGSCPGRSCSGADLPRHRRTVAAAPCGGARRAPERCAVRSPPIPPPSARTSADP